MPDAHASEGVVIGPWRFAYFPDGDDPGEGWLLIEEWVDEDWREIATERNNVQVTREMFREFRRDACAR